MHLPSARLQLLPSEAAVSSACSAVPGRMVISSLSVERLKALLPGRGAALTTPQEVAKGLAGTRSFIADVYESVKAGAAAGRDLKVVYQETMDKLRPKYGHWVIFDHCMPFDVTRCYDEVTQYADPRIWTAERDVQMWKALEG